MAIKKPERQTVLVAEVQMTYADLPTTVAVDAIKLPVNAVVIGGAVVVDVVSNAATTDVLDVGDGAGAQTYVAAANAKALGRTPFIATALDKKYATGDTIKVKRTENGVATAGSFRLQVQYILLNRATEAQP